MSLKFNFHTNADLKGDFFSPDSILNKSKEFNNIINNEKHGFFHLTDQNDLIDQTLLMGEKFKHKKHFVQVGIGGSALGPQMLISALRTNWDMSFTVLDNTDAEYIFDEMNKINIKDAIFYVVSKSGGTAETISIYAIIRNLLKESQITTDQLKDYFVFCTDPVSGQLRKHVIQNDFLALAVPSNIGGRFSVLSPVGLFPALMMGIDIKELFKGANNIKQTLLLDDIEKNSLLQTAAHLSSLLLESIPRIDETVMMPYSSKLKDFAFWFVQLWGESLGKYSTELNVNTGLTPIPAYGATDQHSQMQLFMEGPNNKTIFMLNIANRTKDYSLHNDLEFESAKSLKPYSINQLIEAEFQGSVTALKENNRNIIVIEIDKLDANNVGALILFFESLTVLMGSYLKVDPFNQPGVELGKKYAFEFLNSLSK